MKKNALQRIASNLIVSGVSPVSIQFDSNISNVDNEFLMAKAGLRPSFSRIQWNCIGRATGSQEAIGEALKDSSHALLSFLMQTKLTLVAQPPTGVIPDDHEIPEELILATIAITFAVDYVTELDPASFEEEALSEFVEHNVPYHLWPYWRELLQSLCIRAQLPLPLLPPHMVPPKAQVKQSS